MSAAGRSFRSQVRHHRGWPVCADGVDHGLGVSAAAQPLRDGAGRTGVSVSRQRQPLDGHAAVGHVDLRSHGGAVGDAARSRRARADDVNRNSDGLHAGRRQRSCDALSTGTGACPSPW